MEIYTITDWETGTFRFAIPADVMYAEIYDANNKYITTSYAVEIDNYGVVSLEHDNYADVEFPIKLVTFSGSDSAGGEALFDRSFGAPFSGTRFGIGKRHATAKNITWKDLTQYINDEGNIYVTKQFDGINYGIARDNLDLYSKAETDKMLVGVRAGSSYSYISTKQDIRPFVSQPYPYMTTSFERFVSNFQNGVMSVKLSIPTVGYASVLSGALRICSVSDAIGTSALAPSSTVIALAEVPTLPINAAKMLNLQQVATLTINGLEGLPILVMTSAAVRFCGNDLQENSVYMVCNYVPDSLTQIGMPWVSFGGVTDLSWTLTYYPNDEQLR